MLTSTPDTTRQLVADRHARLAAEARPRPTPALSRRAQAPPGRRRWWAVTRLLLGRT